MPTFQMGMVATIGGIVFADWFCTEVLRLSGDGRIIAWVFPFVSSTFLGVIACYQQLSSIKEPPTDATANLNRLVRNIVVLIPLLVGVAFVIDPLISRAYGKSLLILWTAVAGWGVLKFVFRKKLEWKY